MKRTRLMRKRPMRRFRTKPRPRRLTIAEYAELREQVYARDGWVCRNCGKSRIRPHAHHIVFRSHGGADTLENLITICGPCHTAIHEYRLFIVGNALTARFTTENPRRKSA